MTFRALSPHGHDHQNFRQERKKKKNAPFLSLIRDFIAQIENKLPILASQILVRRLACAHTDQNTLNACTEPDTHRRSRRTGLQHPRQTCERRGRRDEDAAVQGVVAVLNCRTPPSPSWPRVSAISRALLRPKLTLAPSPEKLSPARGARKGRERNRRRLVLVRSRRWRRYHDEQLERHHHRSWTCTLSLFSHSYALTHADLQTVHENRIYSLKITCGEKYPDVPPSAQFISRVNLPFVNQKDGMVDQAKLPVLANWVRNYSIENVLVEIRKYAQSIIYDSRSMCQREMASFNNRKLPQPPEGSIF